MNESSNWDSHGNWIFDLLSTLTVILSLSKTLILSILFFQKIVTINSLTSN
jgi:hypothetical protein